MFQTYSRDEKKNRFKNCLKYGITYFLVGNVNSAVCSEALDKNSFYESCLIYCMFKVFSIFFSFKTANKA